MSRYLLYRRLYLYELVVHDQVLWVCKILQIDNIKTSLKTVGILTALKLDDIQNAYLTSNEPQIDVN